MPTMISEIKLITFYKVSWLVCPFYRPCFNGSGQINLLHHTLSFEPYFISVAIILIIKRTKLSQIDYFICCTNSSPSPLLHSKNTLMLCVELKLRKISAQCTMMVQISHFNVVHFSNVIESFFIVIFLKNLQIKNTITMEKNIKTKIQHIPPNKSSVIKEISRLNKIWNLIFI